MTGACQPGPFAGADVIADLVAEHRALSVILEHLDEADWNWPSAAPGWLIRDQIAHLADTEEVAADTIAGGPRTFARAVAPYATAEDFTWAGCLRGRDLSTRQLTDRWHRSAQTTATLLADMDPHARIAWGFGMPARTFAVARLMEHWAHGVDITDAIGGVPQPTERIWRVAELGLITLRYALARARVPWPHGRTLRLELTWPGGFPRSLGAPDATDVVRGPLLQWCRTAVRRVREPDAAR